MAKAPAFQFYPKDWLADAKVRRLSWPAKGVYIELLALMWNEGKDRLPDNDDIATILGIQVSEWRAFRAQFQRDTSKVFLEERGCLVSHRLREERRKQRHTRKVRQEAARCKWRKFAYAKRCSSSSSASASSTAVEKKKKQPSSPGGDAYSPGFEQWWVAYPKGQRKRGKPQCWKKWKREKLEAQTEQIIACLAAAKKSRDWRKDKGQYIPGPHPWLNSAPWLTEDFAKDAPDGPVPGFVPQMREATPEDAWRRLTDEARRPWIEKARLKLAKTPAPTRFGSGKWPESVIRESGMELWQQDRLRAAGKEKP